MHVAKVSKGPCRCVDFRGPHPLPYQCSVGTSQVPQVWTCVTGVRYIVVSRDSRPCVLYISKERSVGFNTVWNTKTEKRSKAGPSRYYVHKIRKKMQYIYIGSGIEFRHYLHIVAS